MKVVLSILTVIALLFVHNAGAQGKISVKVVTNVNSFSCECGETSFIYKDTFVATTKKVKVLFPLVDFECPKKMMEDDLQDLFKSGTYPYAKLTIVKFANANNTMSAEIQITLKDKTNHYTVALTNTTKAGKSYLKGQQNINLRDFGVDPPTKMMGMIKVKDIVTISFEIPKDEILPTENN